MVATAHLTSNRLARDLLAQQAHLEAPPLHQAQHLSMDLFSQLTCGGQQQCTDAHSGGCFEPSDGGDHTNDSAHKQEHTFVLAPVIDKMT
jgi:hypothetical protein